MIHRHRGNRRYRDYIKAKRKADLIKRGDVFWHYKSFHSLYKGKIHCSCPMCSYKTNCKNNKSQGPVSQILMYKGINISKYLQGDLYKAQSNVTQIRGTRLAGTNNRYGKKNYKISDRRRVDSMLQKEREYKS